MLTAHCQLYPAHYTLPTAHCSLYYIPKLVGWPTRHAEIPHLLWSMNSTNLDWKTSYLQHSLSTNLGFNNPWIQQTWIQQPLGSTILNSTNHRFNKLGFNSPWFQQSLESAVLNSTILRFNNLELKNPWTQLSKRQQIFFRFFFLYYRIHPTPPDIALGYHRIGWPSAITAA